MDILWILWTIPAVIAVEGKLMFWFTGSRRILAPTLELYTKTLALTLANFRFRKGWEGVRIVSVSAS